MDREGGKENRYVGGKVRPRDRERGEESVVFV